MPTIDVKKEQRGVLATQTAATAAGAKTFTAEEKTPAASTPCSTAAPAKPASNSRSVGVSPTSSSPPTTT